MANIWPRRAVLLGTVVLLALTACQKAEIVQTARASVASSAAVYAGAEVVYKTYAGMPRCGRPAAPAKPLCSEATVVVYTGTILQSARQAVDVARNVVNSLPGQGENVAVAALPAETRTIIETAAAQAAVADRAAKAAKAGE